MRAVLRSRGGVSQTHERLMHAPEALVLVQQGVEESGVLGFVSLLKVAVQNEVPGTLTSGCNDGCLEFCDPVSQPYP